jgi:PAS domain S-box-containing protein
MTTDSFDGDNPASYEERYRALVEQAPDAVFVNRNDTVVFANAAALRLLGASQPRQVLGRSPFDFFDPSYHQTMSNRIAVLLAGQPVQLIEARALRLDGTAIDVEVAASPFESAAGMAIQVVLRDITARKQAENRNRQQLDELRRWQEVTLGREARIHDLKREVNELCRRLGEPPRYLSAEDDVETLEKR